VVVASLSGLKIPVTLSSTGRCGKSPTEVFSLRRGGEEVIGIASYLALQYC